MNILQTGDRFIPSELSDAGSNKSLISVDSSAPSMNGTMSDQYDNPVRYMQILFI